MSRPVHLARSLALALGLAALTRSVGLGLLGASLLWILLQRGRPDRWRAALVVLTAGAALIGCGDSDDPAPPPVKPTGTPGRASRARATRAPIRARKSVANGILQFSHEAKSWTI